MNTLPAEVVRQVLREATLIPGAFDYPTRNWEDHEAQVRDLFRKTLQTKLALSLVSKEINLTNRQFLYEFILVQKVQHARPLALLLRAETANEVPRGWWCRRLEVKIGWNYHNWCDGQHTLWGLLPACPRATDISIFLRDEDPPGMHSHRTLDTPPRRYPLSITSMQIVAALQGPNLRSLSLGWRAAIPLSLASELLRFLPALEVVRLDILRVAREPVQQLWTFAYPDAAAEAMGLAPGALQHTAILFGAGLSALLGNDGDEDMGAELDGYGSGDDELRPSRPFDDTHAAYITGREITELAFDREEYSLAVAHSTWPAVPSSSGPDEVFLPKLRILHCSYVVPVLGEWRLPALENVIVNTHHDDTSEERHSTLFTALTPHAAEIKRLRFIPDYRSGTMTDFWRVAESLPGLIELSIHPESTSTDARLSAPHPSLEVVQLVRDIYDDQEQVTVLLENIAMHREEGLLPALRVVELTHPMKKDPSFEEERKRFAQAGVEWVPERYNEDEYYHRVEYS